VTKLIEYVEDPKCDLPQEALSILPALIASLKDLDEKITLLDRDIAKRAREDRVARRSRPPRSA
jgi:transposase